MNRTRITVDVLDVCSPEKLLALLLDRCVVEFDDSPVELVTTALDRASAILEALTVEPGYQIPRLVEAAQGEVDVARALVSAWHRSRPTEEAPQ